MHRSVLFIVTAILICITTAADPTYYFNNLHQGFEQKSFALGPPDGNNVKASEARWSLYIQAILKETAGTVILSREEIQSLDEYKEGEMIKVLWALTSSLSVDVMCSLIWKPHRMLQRSRK